MGRSVYHADAIKERACVAVWIDLKLLVAVMYKGFQWLPLVGSRVVFDGIRFTPHAVDDAPLRLSQPRRDRRFALSREMHQFVVDINTMIVFQEVIL